MASAQEDTRWMRRALRLAQKGFTPPNPMVGCVLVQNGTVVGEGYHPFAGQPHAEVFALRAAGEQAKGATAYVTLEPCCHWGRTPPCSRALIQAHIGRVVVATVDPNPRVGGGGIDELRNAGISVDVGILQAEAQRVNEAFFHFHATRTPFVTLKAAMSLDGKIAAHTGHSQWITGEPARRHVHRLRAQSGAVLVGIGTLLADDAQLTARLPGIALPRQPLRIVVDSHLRIPLDAQAVRLASPSSANLPLLLAATHTPWTPEQQAKAHQLEHAGVEIWRLPATAEGRVSLPTLLSRLAERDIISIFVEGGGEIHASFLAAHCAHKALFFIAPKIIGGRAAPTPVEGAGVDTMEQAYPLDDFAVRRFGRDVMLEGRIASGL